MLVDPDEAADILGKELTPARDLTPEQWDIDDAERESTMKILSRYPELEQYGYFRMIGGHMRLKVMTGTPYLPIK